MATATYNTALSSAAAAAGDVGDQCSHVAVFDDASLTTFKASFALDSVLAGLADGQAIEFDADDLVFTVTLNASSPDHVSASGLVDFLRGLFAENTYLTWHTGAPGANGTANRIAGIAPTLLTVANLNYAE